jgi:uncharacterized protein with HEPN domain
MVNERDKDVIKHILKYCGEVEEIIGMFDATLETLKANVAFKHSSAMCILQIGELTTHFSKEFLESNKRVPWANMRKMRNIAAHHYGEFDLDVLHDTIMNDIPELKRYCLELLAEK